MLQYAADVGKVVQGLGVVVENQSGLLRFALRNWPITGIILAAWGTQMYRRFKKKELTFYNALVDSGAIISPAVGLMLLAKLTNERIQESEDQELIQKLATVQPEGAAGLGGAQIIGKLA